MLLQHLLNMKWVYFILSVLTVWPMVGPQKPEIPCKYILSVVNTTAGHEVSRKFLYPVGADMELHIIIFEHRRISSPVTWPDLTYEIWRIGAIALESRYRLAHSYITHDSVKEKWPRTWRSYFCPLTRTQGSRQCQTHGAGRDRASRSWWGVEAGGTFRDRSCKD